MKPALLASERLARGVVWVNQSGAVCVPTITRLPSPTPTSGLPCCPFAHHAPCHCWTMEMTTSSSPWT